MGATRAVDKAEHNTAHLTAQGAVQLLGVGSVSSRMSSQ